MIGIVVGALGFLVGGFLLLRWMMDADPRGLARALKAAGVVLVAGLALLLLFTRNLGPALVLMSLLLPQLLKRRHLARRAKAARGPSAQQSSSIRTAWLDVSLAHDTGEVTGRVMAGQFTGRAIESLSRDELIRLNDECRVADPQSQAVIEAYLDRRYGFDWRADAADDPSADGGGPRRGPMGEDEALVVLGLGPGASEAEIKAAYHRLMKRHHPDQGGSAEMAARLNEARDRLLGYR